MLIFFFFFYFIVPRDAYAITQLCQTTVPSLNTIFFLVMCLQMHHSVLFEREFFTLGLLSRQVWFMSVIHIWKRKTKRLYEKHKSHIHQIHSDIDFLLLHELSQNHIHSISVDVWPRVCVWESLWCSQKDLPVLLTACPTLSVVHNWFPPFKSAYIYCLSTHSQENKLRKQVFGSRNDRPGKGILVLHTLWLIYESWHGCESFFTVVLCCCSPGE